MVRTVEESEFDFNQKNFMLFLSLISNQNEEECDQTD